jgi:hypothetical protein
MRKMREDKDYKIVNSEDELCHVELLKKPFAGVVVKFGTVSFGTKDNPDGTINMNFDFDVMKTNDVAKEKLDSIEFNECLGDVLFSILENNLSENSLQKVDPEEFMNEFREDVVEESDLERTVRTKSSTIRKR